MMNARVLKYTFIFTGPIIGFIALSLSGWWTWLLVIYAFGLVPLLELLMQPDPKNLNKAEEEMIKDDKVYDWLLYLMVPVQFALVFYFLYVIQEPGLSTFEVAGKVVTLGIGCGILGINIGHELGHRVKPHERFLAKSLLLTSLYMHFFIEHNRGHHKNVSTDDDPASADRGEVIYTFWFKSIIYGYISAWKLEADRLKKKGQSFFSYHNEMIRFHVIQIGFLALIYFVFGLVPMLLFMCSALIGILLLETVNYIEHYGLRRKQLDNGKYERVLPVHSWNSNHPIGRIMLFELSRHSDHHYKASRKYQILKNYDEAPQMPTGYPGMVLLALIPPAWFYVMHRQIDEYRNSLPEGAALA